MDISDFVPVFPDEPDTNNITRRLEFNRHWSDPDRDRKLAEGHQNYETLNYFEHQKLIITYMLVFDRLFLFHRAGAGKTLAFLGASEALHKAYLMSKTNIKKTVILTEQQGNIKEELLKFPEYTSVPAYYQIMGYQKFLNSINSENYRNYDDTFFIIDEAHNLKKENKVTKVSLDGDYVIEEEGIENLKKEENKNVEKLYDLFNTARRIKICVATATPVFDTPKDLISVMNFLLPREKWIVESDLLSYDLMKNKIGNIVSFISELKTGVKLNYKKRGESEIKPGLFELELSDLQKKEITACKENCRKMEGKSLIIGMEFSARIGMEKLGLDILKKVSPKTHFLVSESMKKETGSCFAFSPLYTKNVIDIVKKALIDNGFEEYKGGILNTKKLRFISFESGLNDDTRFKFINEFNKSQNVNGEYIKLFLSGPVGTEGISLKNVITVFVLTPAWNYSRLYQGVARSFRSTSHTALLKSGLPVSINVYFMCSVWNDRIVNKEGETEKDKETNDILMYDVCYQKDLQIKKVERILKRLSFDCVINYSRNKVIDFEDYSPECDYEICDWICDGIEGRGLDLQEYNNFDLKKLNGKKIITDEYNILFYSEMIPYISEILFNKLKTEGYIDLNALYLLFPVNKLVVNQALSAILNKTITPVNDQFGFPKFPKLSGNQIILVDVIDFGPEKNRFNTHFFNKNIFAYRINELELKIENPLKNELEKRIMGREYDQEILENDKIYWFAIDKDEYERILSDLKKPKQGKKTVTGNPTDQQIMTQNLPTPKRNVSFNDEEIIFTNVFLKDLKNRTGISKTGFVSEILNSKDGEIEKVEFYENGWKTEPVKSSILRGVIKKFYIERLNRFFEKMNIFGNFFSVFPDGIIRLHIMKNGAITPGLDIIPNKDFEKKAKEIGGFNSLEISQMKKDPEIFKKYLFQQGKLFNFETSHLRLD